MKRKFRNYLINKNMQLGITIKYLFLAILSSLMTGCVVYITIWPVINNFVPYALISRIHYQILFRLICYGFPLTFVITAFCIVITHKIAGPLYNIEQKLDRLAQGEDVESIQLRKGDELKGLAAKINDLILKLKKYKDTCKLD
ncbi:HAMP domain-containing protein [Desulfonema magnum]|uniref:HAMP domain-containing protein n=1 Tax=Desulfonema magnum TaxID=45655 RepID=A0A975BZ20_9BACT|nr:hypothetical protein [Desulfonema magnum]QTA93678.1 HAMP domain-containing protein [Desulfonema magnum]